MLIGLLYLGDKNHQIIDSALTKFKHNIMFPIMLIECFLMSHLTISIQVNHVSKYKYSPWSNRLNIVILILLSSIYITAIIYPPNYYKVLYAVTYIMLAVTLISEFHFILNVVPEMANALNIRILCVKEKIPESELV